MIEKIELIDKMCEKITKLPSSEITDTFHSVLKKITPKIDNYIGDYPTFIEPVFLGNDVKIGDDVLLGPNVYIGKNSIIGDYVEISNSIILDNVEIGENFKLENCIVCKNSKFKFSKFIAKSSILSGSATSQKQLKIIKF